VINGAHTIIYSEDAEATREFLRDVLELEAVDAGGGWLIFALPPGEVAAHPSDIGGRHELFLMCDDIDSTVLELSARGVVFTGPIHDEGWGRVTALQVPGAGSLGLYEPRHQRP
jgi:catechol 2,3-dioxygenase-like lactoylglutathione lyase family enzyme